MGYVAKWAVRAINAEFALRLGYAAGRVLAREHAARGGSRPQVVIGKDTRISGYAGIRLEAGLSAAGIDVLLAGPIPTPAVAYLTRALRLVAGIVISASHNPYQDNGIKFFSAQGMKLLDEIESRHRGRAGRTAGLRQLGRAGRARRMSGLPQGRYIEFCKSTFPNDLDLNGMKIVVDAAHGAAYNIAPHVFRELGAEVHAIGVHPDGFNINKGVGALHPELLAKEVKARGAQLGVALDGDARPPADGGRRRPRLQRRRTAVRHRARTHAARQGRTGWSGTLMTNFGFEREMKRLGVGFERANVGDRLRAGADAVARLAVWRRSSGTRALPGLPFRPETASSRPCRSDRATPQFARRWPIASATCACNRRR